MTTPKLGDRPASEMTVREKMAMEICASLAIDSEFKEGPSDAAFIAVRWTDELIRELERVR